MRTACAVQCIERKCMQCIDRWKSTPVTLQMCYSYDHYLESSERKNIPCVATCSNNSPPPRQPAATSHTYAQPCLLNIYIYREGERKDLYMSCCYRSFSGPNPYSLVCSHFTHINIVAALTSLLVETLPSATFLVLPL